MSLLFGCYLLCVSLFLVHELDAVRRHEWRVMPVLSGLAEGVSYQIFLWLHVPLIAAVMWVSFANGGSSEFRTGFCVFSILHVFAHKYFERHPAYEFNNPASKLLIRATGLSGAGYLGLQL